jgi:hypothetical protein
MDTFGDFVNNTKFSDLEFSFADDSKIVVFAHKIVLYQRSELLTALEIDTEAREISKVQIDDCSVEDFVFLLHFIYNQHLQSEALAIERCLTLMQLASHYRISSLLALMKSKVECELSQHTVMKALGAAEATATQRNNLSHPISPRARSKATSPRAHSMHLESAAMMESVKSTCMRFLQRLDDSAFETATAASNSACCSCELIVDIFTRRSVSSSQYASSLRPLA